MHRYPTGRRISRYQLHHVTRWTLTQHSIVSRRGCLQHHPLCQDTTTRCYLPGNLFCSYIWIFFTCVAPSSEHLGHLALFSVLDLTLIVLKFSVELKLEAHRTLVRGACLFWPIGHSIFNGILFGIFRYVVLLLCGCVHFSSFQKHTVHAIITRARQVCKTDIIIGLP